MPQAIQLPAGLIDADLAFRRSGDTSAGMVEQHWPKRRLTDRHGRPILDQHGAPLLEHWPVEPFTPGAIAKGDQGLHVRANYSRWVIDCPSCNSAQLASKTDHRFFCLDPRCLNSYCQGRWRRVIWPDDPAAIEHLLAHRYVRNRNWQHPETVADLLAENQQHGVPI